MNGSRARPDLATPLLLAVAALVRLPGLTGWAFEPDELSTWHDSLTMAGPSANGPGALGRPVYYAWQHLLLGLAPGGGSPLLLRISPLVFGLVGVWLTVVVGRRLFGPAAGVVAALLLALSPWHQYASGFARYWTLVYVFALLAIWCLLEGRHRLAALVLTLGALTHPTFLFPIVGVILALHLLTPDGEWGWRWPSRAEWLNLWVPFVVLAGGWFVGLKLSGNAHALSNWNGRGFAATLGIFPGMIEWIAPAVALACAVGLGVLWWSAKGEDRRWAGLAACGLASGCLLLIAAGRKTDVYADYGMAMLPLVYLTIGGAVDRVTGGLVPQAVAAAAVVAAGAVPGLVSNLRDGMRFEPRPAFDYVKRNGGGHLLLGPSGSEQAYYAPGLPFKELADSIHLPEMLSRAGGGFWLMVARHRNGWINGDAQAQAWVDRECHVVLRTGTPRLDYRQYDVDLNWCGASAP